MGGKELKRRLVHGVALTIMASSKEVCTAVATVFTAKVMFAV